MVVLVHCVPVNAPKVPSVHSDFGAPVKVVTHVPLPVAAWLVSGNAALLIVVAAHLLKTMQTSMKRHQLINIDQSVRRQEVPEPVYPELQVHVPALWLQVAFGSHVR